MTADAASKTPTSTSQHSCAEKPNSLMPSPNGMHSQDSANMGKDGKKSTTKQNWMNKTQTREQCKRPHVRRLNGEYG